MKDILNMLNLFCGAGPQDRLFCHVRRERSQQTGLEQVIEPISKSVARWELPLNVTPKLCFKPPLQV